MNINNLHFAYLFYLCKRRVATVQYQAISAQATKACVTRTMCVNSSALLNTDTIINLLIQSDHFCPQNVSLQHLIWQ